MILGFGHLVELSGATFPGPTKIALPFVPGLVPTHQQAGALHTGSWGAASCACQQICLTASAHCTPSAQCSTQAQREIRVHSCTAGARRCQLAVCLWCCCRNMQLIAAPHTNVNRNTLLMWLHQAMTRPVTHLTDTSTSGSSASQ